MRVSASTRGGAISAPFNAMPCWRVERCPFSAASRKSRACRELERIGYEVYYLASANVATSADAPSTAPRAGFGRRSDRGRSSRTSGRDLDGRGLIDFVDRIGERLVELRVVHRTPEILRERTREACDHAVILCQAFASLVPRKAAGEGDHADYPLVHDERRIKVRRARNRQFEHHFAPLRQGVEPLRDLRKKDGLGTRLVLALDRDLGFDDRH